MRKARKLISSAVQEARSRAEVGLPMPLEDAIEHVAEGDLLDQVDLGMVNAMRALQRWLRGLTGDAGFPHLSVIDAIVLDQLEQRAQHRRLAEICFMLNTDDMHVIAYSLRKMAGLGIVDMTRHGKEVTYSIRADSAERLLRFREMQEHRLLEALSALEINTKVSGRHAWRMRRLSGLYDQAARAAASL